MTDYKHTPLGMIPRGWKLGTIEDFGKVLTGSTPPTSDASHFGTDYMFVTPADIGTNKYIIRTERGLTKYGIQKCRTLPPSTVVFVCIGSTIGKVGIVTKICTANQQINAVVPRERNEGGYLFYFLQLRSGAIARLATKQAVPIINKSHFASIPLAIPDFIEQRAICDILDHWDRTIYLTERLIATKQERRKWLIQQLLTGKRRLTGFALRSKNIGSKHSNLPEDWGYPQIGKLAQEVTTKNTDGTGLPVLSCTKYQGLVDSLQYFGKQMFSQDLSTYKVVRRDQFAYATNHIDEGSIGYQNLYDEALISPMYTVFQADNSQIDDSFLYLVLKTETYRRIFAAGTSASVNRRGSLRWKEFSRIHIPLPSIEEQKEIIRVITTTDHELDLLRAQLDALQEQKKGLMQQLLTGKKRVKILSAEAIAEEKS